MKFFKKVAVVLFFATIFSGTTFAEPVPLRGIVEGFYGTPWTFSDRVNIFEFCRTHNLNAYIYAPKDDLYHRSKWREPYPKAELEKLDKLIDAAKKNNVRFIFAISPGLDLHYKGKKADEDFSKLVQKIESVYKLGARDFAIFLDDLKDEKGEHHEDGKLQALFLNKLQRELRSKFKDTAPLITVPTEYYYEDMIDGRKIKSYTEDFSVNLDEKILVLYTGNGVVCDVITREDYNAANKIYGRELGVWWNYPVNDYPLTSEGNRSVKLALGAIEKLPSETLPAIFFNPMNQAEMSKISLATGADYANAPNLYDAEKSWDKAIKNQFGELAPAMKIFAEHSRHMENSWAKVGSADGSEFATLSYLLFSDIRAGRKANFDSLEKVITEMENSADTLLKNLPQKYLSECKPQLEQFKRIANADRIALNSLKSGKLNPQLKKLREDISLHEKIAVVSEMSARKFIDDTLKFFGE